MTAKLIKLETAPDLVDQVYSSLLDAISEGSLAPGARITQEDIAEQLAVSRQPVLQALRLLKKEGFVLDAPGRGVRVAPLDVAWIGNVYQVRSALDALAVRLAARQRYQFDRKLIEQSARVHWRYLRWIMGAVLQSSRQRHVERAAKLIDHHSEQASSHLTAHLSVQLSQLPTTSVGGKP